ncbi:MAG TPA: acetylxylan esterase [Tepidisphaeraceae bacterium]|jgi:cephalosporin-C deacetylase-like acetyl esterase/lysophospholipase L1-like esterase
MHRLKKPFTLAISGLVILLAAATWTAAQDLHLSPSKKTEIYAPGERLGWTVSLADGGATRTYAFVIRKNNLDVIKSGQLDFSSSKTAEVDVTIDEPAMLFLELTPTPAGATTAPSTRPGGAPRRIVAGAAVAPEKLQPAVARPADFDSFWESKIHQLKQIPENPVLTPAEVNNPNIEYATIKMDHVDGKHVYGQLAKPKREGKFPALVIFQWASPPYPLQKSWVTGHAAAGWLTLNIEPHDVLPDQPQSYYDALPKEIKNYAFIGNDDRDKSYFLQMYLADYRAVDYIAGRPDWDGKTLVVMGTSMGGQQSLCVAGLHPKVTHLIVNEPAGCDTNGPLHGRQSGYPNFPSDNPKIMQTALYFDAVNFAPRINARCMVAMGFVDTIAPPAGIWTAFNQIKGPKQAVPMVDSPHNNLATPQQQRPYTDTSAKWLDTLAKGGEVPPPSTQPAARASSASDPVARTDANSQLAHQQLLDKARRGGIDIYFAGDSITRRWGCSDAQYAPFLENWKANFFGWNAADFGWGGDTTQNILWRLQHGELDGVNPKVIVILAGTNNVGTRPGDDEKVADIARGIEAIVSTCRSKAPGATIVLTAIFPRNDNPAVMPTINRINERIAQLADGKTVRFLNINDKLADSEGKLFEGMMNPDKLHPTVKTYQIWADGLRPIFTELLGPPAHTDHAPPPTGDPSAAPKAPTSR